MVGALALGAIAVAAALAGGAAYGFATTYTPKPIDYNAIILTAMGQQAAAANPQSYTQNYQNNSTSGVIGGIMDAIGGILPLLLIFFMLKR